MASTTNYVVDANVYITAYRNYYAFDLVGAFWKQLVAHAKSGRIISIDRIKDELQDEKYKGDQLAVWACNDCAHAFESTDRPDVIDHFTKIMQWVQGFDFTEPAKAEFAASPDGWLIAYAKAAGHTLVTHESYEPDRKNKVKIPNVCKKFSVPYVNTFAMLRDLGIRLG